MSTTSELVQVLAHGEDRSAYRSGTGTVLGSNLWDSDRDYLVVPAGADVPEAILDELGVAVVLEKPGVGAE